MSESETPRGTSRPVTRRNILDALTGSNNRRSGSVPTIAQQKAAQRERERQRKMQANLEILMDRQNMLLEKLLRMDESLQEEAISVHLLRLHQETLRRTADDFEKAYSEMIALLPKEDRATQRYEYTNFEELHNNLYVKVLTRIDQTEQQMKLQEVQNAPKAVTPGPSVPVAPVYIQAPTPQLHAPFPSFGGEPENWFSFKSLFQSVMARYKNEPDAMKILHLRNALTGEAKDKIDQDVVNNNSYETAWKILEKAYEDKRLILDTHIDAILDCPKIGKENRGKSLSKLVEICDKHADALGGHGYPVEGLAELILVNVLYKKLDKDSQEQWELKIGNGELPEFEEFMDFLRERGRILQRTSRGQQQVVQQPAGATTKQRQLSGQKSHPASKSFVQLAKESCSCCKAEHSIYRCEKFQNMSVQERKTVIAKANLCFNCFRATHRVANCPSDRGCKVCGRKHHSLLHHNDAPSSQSTIPEKKEEQSEDHPAEPAVRAQNQQNVPDQQCSATTLCANIGGGKSQVVLSTAQVMVAGKGSTIVKCRALLDSGSDSNIITEKLARRLQLKLDPVDLPISGLNNIETRVKYLLSTKFTSCTNSFASSVLDFLVVPRVTSNLPVVEIDARSWPIPTGLYFADPTFHTPGDIDMIIGNEVFFDLVKTGRMKLGCYGITLAETELGWVVAGSVPTRKAKSYPRVCQLNRHEESLNATMSKFWEIENVCSERIPSTPDDAVEKHFLSTHYRDETGRYVVRLPFNGLQSQLGDSYDLARRRLDKLMISLARNPAKKLQYNEFLAEYLALGHMREVKGPIDNGYYIPHQAVYKMSSSTTKIRVVYNASAKTTTGISLNDTLLVGPTVQNDIVSILLRFCVHQVALTADVPKMYRQVWLHDDDCKYQLILWWDNDNNLKVFELRTVTYGVASSPHHATRVLMQLATDEGEEFPRAKQVIIKDSYIDDFLTGGSSVEEVLQLYTELSELLRRGGFGAHKFCSNSAEVLQAIPEELQEQQVSFDDTGINNSIKTLGLIWNPQEDHFRFRTAQDDLEATMTKRKVLSEIGQLFDPLGFLGPIIVTAKLVMQDIWRLGLEWDEKLPEELQKRWVQFCSQLPAVNQMLKSRCVIEKGADTIELHGFSDASMRAYGAVVYIRSISKDGVISVSLVASKSRVAPLKPSTIPRLELCGALLLAELVRKVMSAMQISFDTVKLWCDSQIVLCWLKKSPTALNQFVANRVAAIVEQTQGYQWGYIQSAENPADVISRGELPRDLLQRNLWWKGSPVLWQPHPASSDPEPLEEADIPEVKSAVVLAIVKPGPAIVLDRLSNYTRMLRAWVYVHRYIDMKVHKKQGFGDISADEIKRAETSLLYVVQRQCFSDLLKALQSKSVHRHGMRNLAPFLGDDGLIRVGGRLKYSAIPYTGKHQVLLPEKHHVTEAIIRKLHLEHFHVGQNGLLAIVRERYWPVGVNQIIKKVVSNCQLCARLNPSPGRQFMGDLPGFRVNPAPTFSNVGIDYAWPYTLQLGGKRTKSCIRHVGEGHSLRVWLKPVNDFPVVGDCRAIYTCGHRRSGDS